jgi:hypothetical protein
MTLESAVGTVTPQRGRDRALAHVVGWWRDNVTLARIPLPMLSLAASFGVYQFSLLFVPWWVALAEAFAFEATYIGLSTLRVEDDKQRSRARLISQGSVAVSVIYNSLAAFLHRNPLILDSLDSWSRIGAEVVLAVLHGAPLAIVAYFVADLLLHEGLKPRTAEVKPAIDWTAILNQMSEQFRQDLSTAVDTLRQEMEANAATLHGKVETLGQNLADHVEGSSQRLDTLKGNVGKEVEALRQDLTERLPTYNCRYCDKGFNDKSARGGHEPHCQDNPGKRGRAHELPVMNGHGGTS